jgi:tyrosyl-tRNA synthetase
MIKQGAVKIDGERIDGEFIDIADVIDTVLQVGKRRFIRIVRE